MPESEPKPQRDAALSSEYHKAHKQVMLWAAILFIWELVGVDLGKAEKAGGNVGPIVTALKSPQAVPWVLVILVVYFTFKLRIEWRQCGETRRQVREAKQDYYSACMVAAVACLLFFGQTISRIQFADVIQGSNRVQSISLGLTAGMFLTHGTRYLWLWIAERRRRTNPSESISFSLFIVSIGVAALAMALIGHPHFWLLALGLVIGGIVSAAMFLIFRILVDQPLPKK